MAPIDGAGIVRTAGPRRLLLLDEATSAALPSRGQVAVRATIAHITRDCRTNR